MNEKQKLQHTTTVSQILGTEGIQARIAEYQSSSGEVELNTTLPELERTLALYAFTLCGYEFLYTELKKMMDDHKAGTLTNRQFRRRYEALYEEHRSTLARGIALGDYTKTKIVLKDDTDGSTK